MAKTSAIPQNSWATPVAGFHSSGHQEKVRPIPPAAAEFVRTVRDQTIQSRQNG